MTQCNLKDMESMTEEEYLAQYKPSDYERPSVTVDFYDNPQSASCYDPDQERRASGAGQMGNTGWIRGDG